MIVEQGFPKGVIMYTNNDRLSKRQIFRLGMMENITVPMVTIPYIVFSGSGNSSMMALIIGMAMAIAYYFLIYFFSSCFSHGYVDETRRYMGHAAIIFYVIYAGRFILKAGILILFFSRVIQNYLLRSCNLWFILVSFALICGYGASRDMEKRGRMAEVLYPWMVVPLIIVLVFSICNMDWSSIWTNIVRIKPESFFSSEWLSGYYILIMFSAMELMLFSFTCQKKNSLQTAQLLLIWIVIAVIISYTYILGILGEGWIAEDSIAAFNVAEAGSFPGHIMERMDYQILTFWIIGAFMITCGYMYHAKVFVGRIIEMGSRKKETQNHELLTVSFVIVFSVAACCFTNEESLRLFVAGYMKYVDVPVSLLLPAVVLITKKYGRKDKCEHKKNRLKAGKMSMFFLLISAMTVTLSACSKEAYAPIEKRATSLENRDYAVSIIFNPDEEGCEVEVAKLTEYKGSSENDLESESYSLKGDSVRQLLYSYESIYGRSLDLGHLEEITIRYTKKDDLAELVKELANNPALAKSVYVELDDKKIMLRELIKDVYSWE